MCFDAAIRARKAFFYKKQSKYQKKQISLQKKTRHAHADFYFMEP